MKPMITNILFATDLSQNSTYALRHAASLSQATGAKIHVVHVNAPLSDDARVTLEMFVQDDQTLKDALEQRYEMVKQILTERQEQFWSSLTGEDSKIREQVATIEVTDGHPAEVILRRAREMNCDLIMLGSHDHGSTQTFLGTVAKRVLRRANIPTLIVPYQDETRHYLST